MLEGTIWGELIHHYPTLIAAASAAIGAIYYIIKSWILPMIKAFKRYTKLCEKVDIVFEELQPNGGHSIKDAISRLEATVTEIKDVHLRRLSERQKALLADKRTALFETDSEGNCIWVNRTYARVAGRTPSELYGHGWQNAIAKDQRDYVTKSWYRAVEESRELILDFSFETPDGIKTPATIKSYKLADEHNNVLGYFGQIHLKKLQEEFNEHP